jgi:hypothetical protein
LGLLVTSHFHFRVLRVEVNHVLDFISNQMREGGRRPLWIGCKLCLDLNEIFLVCILFCVGTRSEIFLLVFVALVSVRGVGRGRRPDFLSWSISILAGSRLALVSFNFSAARSRFGSCRATVLLRVVL